MAAGSVVGARDEAAAACRVPSREVPDGAPSRVDASRHASATHGGSRIPLLTGEQQKHDGVRTVRSEPAGERLLLPAGTC